MKLSDLHQESFESVVAVRNILEEALHPYQTNPRFWDLISTAAGIIPAMNSIEIHPDKIHDEIKNIKLALEDVFAQKFENKKKQLKANEIATLNEQSILLINQCLSNILTYVNNENGQKKFPEKWINDEFLKLDAFCIKYPEITKGWQLRQRFAERRHESNIYLTIDAFRRNFLENRSLAMSKKS